MNTWEYWDISRGYSTGQYESIIGNLRDGNSIAKYEGTAFHYTSFENGLNMLKSSQDGNVVYWELWASHFHFQNDTSEFLIGLKTIIGMLEELNFKDEKVRSVVEKFKDVYGKFDDFTSFQTSSMPPHYLVSFSKDCNLLSQWKYYGKNCGIAIEYKLDKCVFSNDRLDDLYIGHDAFNVIYNQTDHKSSIGTILQRLKDCKGVVNKEIFAMNTLLKACAAASFMKSKHYSDEDEVRMLFAPYYSDIEDETHEVSVNELAKKIEYRTRQDQYIIPYIKIRLKQCDNLSPIASITVGPGQNQESIFKSLIMLVQSRVQVNPSKVENIGEQYDCYGVKVNGIVIRRSLIPFRG